MIIADALENMKDKKLFDFKSMVKKIEKSSFLDCLSKRYHK